MTSPREKYLAMLKVSLPKEIEEAKARHPQMKELLEFLLSHVEAVGPKADASDKQDLEVAERRLPAGLSGLWHAVDLAVEKGVRDDDVFARSIETVAMCAFVIGSRASISNNSQKYVKSKQTQGGRSANSGQAERRYTAFEREIGPFLEIGENAKTTERRIKKKKAADAEFAQTIGEISETVLRKWVKRYRVEHGN